MPEQPSFPKDAAVGADAAKDQAQEAAAGGEEAEGRRSKYVRAGVAVGIGSAAIVAALLYANRGKRNDRS
jgi:hypothetical protein